MDWAAKARALKRAAEKAAQLRREMTPGAMARAEAMPGPGKVAAEIGGMRAEALVPRVEERVSALGPEAAYLLPEEAAKAGRGGSIQDMQRMLDFLPKAKELAAVMKAGGAKRGWYRASSQAILDTFGKDDAPRFAALLAAMSPQTSVEMNLQNALNTWKNWTAAGRPTDERAIREIMGRSVAGTKGEESVLDAWVGNSLRALQAEDPSKVRLSGPKVDSFMANLADDVYRVTNDAWNANLLGVSQKLFSGSMSKANPNDPGLTPGYIATSARMRHAADLAGMTPAEGQETAWSFAMQLYERAKATGQSVTDLLESGGATDALVRGAPDFSTLFQQPQYRGILEQAGYGEQLGKLQPHAWPDMSHDIRDRLTPEELKLVRGTAGRLDELMNQRSREAFSRSFWNQDEQPERLPVFGTFETTPYADSGHLPGFLSLAPSEQTTAASRLASPFRNFAERDVLHEALGLPGIETRKATGLWSPPGGGFEVNPAFSAGVELPITKAGELRTVDANKLRAAEAARGFMTAQGGSAYSGMLPGGEGGFYIPLAKKADPNAMRQAGEVANMGDFFLADTGAGVNVLPGGGTIGEDALVGLRRAFAQTHDKPGLEAPYTELPAIVPGKPISGYVDFTDAWKAEPGSGAATRQMLEALDVLPGNQQRALGAAMQRPAGDLFDLYRNLEKGKGLPVREDLMNALQILRTQGLEGLRAALGRGEFLASLGPLLMPGMPLVPAAGPQESWA